MVIGTGIEKAVVAFLLSAVALANVGFALDWNIDENLVTTIVGVVVMLGTTFGVWATVNSTDES